MDARQGKADDFIERLERELRASGASEAEIADVLKYLRAAGAADPAALEPRADTGLWRQCGVEPGARRAFP